MSLVIRSERLICREVQVNSAYRWFCKSASKMPSRIIQHFPRACNERFCEGNIFRHVFERVVEEAACGQDWL